MEGRYFITGFLDGALLVRRCDNPHDVPAIVTELLTLGILPARISVQNRYLGMDETYRFVERG